MNNTNYGANYPANSFQQNYMNQFGMNQQNQNGNIFATFAKGMDAAKQYPAAAGSIVFIFDSTPNTNVFYMKDTTGNGEPFRIFDYTEREAPDETKELNDLKKQVANLETLVASLAKPLQELMGTNGKENENA